MSSNKKPARTSQTKKVLLIFVAVILAGAVFYSFSQFLVPDCGAQAKQAEKLIKKKQYKQAYELLKPKQQACGAAKNKASVTAVQFSRYLAASSYREGDKKLAEKSAQSALDGYKKLNEADRAEIKDSINFAFDMNDIIGGYY